MAKLESSFKNMVISLTGISLFAALALGSVYTLTKEPIEASKTAKLQNAINEVVPGFKRLDEPEKVAISAGDSINVYRAYDANEKFMGAAVESLSHKGFSGDIRIMVGFDVNGNIINYSVLEQKETPGLGTKMVEWFKTDKGNQSVKGKNPAKNKLTVSKDGGEVDAITAATISSRAFLNAISNAYEAYSKNANATDGESGATVKNEVASDNDKTVSN